MLVKVLVTRMVLGSALLVVSGCDFSGPSQIASPSVGRGSTKYWESGATVYWNGVARGLVFARGLNPFQAIRGFAILGAAQYNAAVAAEGSKDGNVHASVRAAVAGASAVVLTYLFPQDAGALAGQLAEFLASPTWPGDRHEDQASGEAIGRGVGQGLVARAITDGFFDPWSGTVPLGPGIWFSSAIPPAPPVGPQFGQARTYYLLSGDQFRPPPPPAFGSAEFQAALAEVRGFSDTEPSSRIPWPGSGTGHRGCGRLPVTGTRRRRNSRSSITLASDRPPICSPW